MLQVREHAAAARNPLSWGVSASAGPPDVSIDPNGNLTQKIEGADTWTYEWTAANQLKRVLKNSVEQARFAYDPMGRRVEKVAGGVTTTYTYDAEDILREISGSTTLKYLHAEGIDEPLGQEDGAGNLSYFHADGLGSIVKTTNFAGAVTTTRRYDAYGNLEVGAANGLAFTGREWDAEAGLYYYRARYYDPKVGRFISEDPIGLESGDVNFYAYVRNNPMNFTDPKGLAPVTNNSPRPIPIKPEDCSGGTCTIQMCMPGQTCDADGVYPPDCRSNPIKIINQCKGEVTPDGKLRIICPFSFNVVQRFRGGQVSGGFMNDHPDWPPPNSAPGCQRSCGN